ncbi:hypothetical protein VNO78_21387 [Psophocarpus tetragonolobus]|uniref:Uncharacterized protein n=1 Tax=Psophocarpus tetragonolobus TaxID=3891 RepID=A0AAN9SGI1_PSOTE
MVSFPHFGKIPSIVNVNIFPPINFELGKFKDLDVFQRRHLLDYTIHSSSTTYRKNIFQDSLTPALKKKKTDQQ